MFFAYLETAAGQMTIGLVDISKEELQGSLQPLDALFNALAIVRGPLLLTSTHTMVGEARLGTPANLTFKYLGTLSVELPSEAASNESANAYLARGVYECPDTLKAAEDGKFRTQCQYFQLIGEEGPGGAAPTVH